MNFYTSGVKRVVLKRAEFDRVWMLCMVFMASGTVNTSVPLLSYRADVMVDINSGLLSPSAMPDSDIIRLKASRKVDQKVL